MRFPRRLLDNAAVQGALAWTVAGYLGLVYRTIRWRRIGFEAAEGQAIAGGRTSAIACFWHGRLLMMPFARHGRYSYTMLISGHRDGRLIAQTVRRLGIGTIVGSSTRGGAVATRASVERLRQGGAVICVTPDGPRGPRMRANPGAVEIARMAGVMLIPITYGVTRRRLLASWDRFLLPLPFGRGVFICGTPVDPAGLAPEAARAALERQLNAVTVEADRLTGHAPLAPAQARRPAVQPGKAAP
jgi:lysophospholipid acyltransferase (LPLAT)-like uncharacterized protein